MSSPRNNTIKSRLMVTVAVAVVVVIALLVGWYFFRDENISDGESNTVNTTPKTETSNLTLQLDESKVVGGWSAYTNEPAVISVSNTSGEEVTKNLCTVEAHVILDDLAKSSNPGYAEVLEAKSQNLSKTNKGYEYQLIEKKPVQIMVNGKQESIEGYYGKYYLLDGSNAIYRWDSYYMSDGAYTTFSSICQKDSLDESKQVLTAISLDKR